MTGRMSTSVPSYIPGGVNTTRCDRFPTMLLFLHSRTEVLLCCNSGIDGGGLSTMSLLPPNYRNKEHGVCSIVHC